MATVGPQRKTRHGKACAAAPRRRHCQRVRWERHNPLECLGNFVLLQNSSTDPAYWWRHHKTFRCEEDEGKAMSGYFNNCIEKFITSSFVP
ncbi:hypothetical protein O3P69_009781 [Scylla paramamosain]|uniref:Uncharacterized protein n=1 Tax=Scylla paramamosain TaxID=85552 RepID=A0AAW0SNK8_SCYPA